jgi:cell shape-determining protein MreC
MQKIDIKTVIIVLLIIINLYQFQMNFSSERTVDISNVFLKDKIESLNRDLNTVNVKLKLLDNIQIRLENLKQEIEDLETKLTENTNQKK